MAKIERIEVDQNDGTVQFYFDDEPNNPFFTFEFPTNTTRRDILNNIAVDVRDWNKEYDKDSTGELVKRED